MDVVLVNAVTTTMMECVGDVFVALIRFNLQKTFNLYFVQIDPCFIPRNTLHCLCLCIPCGCIAEETITTVCCCNPGRETVDHNTKK